MADLRKYIEWMSRGRRTDRVAYVLKEWDCLTLSQARSGSSTSNSILLTRS